MDIKTILRMGATAGLIGLFSIVLPAAALALTPEQVIALKKAGVGDETIRLMIQQEEAGRNGPDGAMGRREIKDGEGNAVVIYSTGRPVQSDAGEGEKKKVENSWKMLENMIIDGRSKPGASSTPK